MTLRDKIIELREKLGISRTEFAAKIGVSAAYIHILESGKQDVTLRVLESISKSFNIPLSYFFEDFEIEESNVIILSKIPIKAKIDEKMKYNEINLGEMFLEEKYVKKEAFVIQYKGLDIDNFEVKKDDLLLVTKFDNLKSGDKLITIINNFVKFCTLSINRGNILLIPSDSNELCYVYDDKKMQVLKINKIIRRKNLS
ncbi:MAG TPA: helix-turn-helix transcriptional regulator [Caldisericia bacterium]|nr:helix-turn-helix transcriptional regulator [Caldisericia bacterium]HOL82904.1 helix-turn-helix transcriptional regulator [Caldisericia bacterium]HPP43019.1 helix-turn-helix transcriptional regulator [Caldisericia bacterium]HQJ56023.1 helix-turn-helix transcriptional regulator [Caldisericia bacterium]